MAILGPDGKPAATRENKRQTVFVTCDAPGDEWKVGSVLLIREHAALGEKPYAVAARTPTPEEMLFVTRALIETGRLEMAVNREGKVEWETLPPESTHAFRLAATPSGPADADDVPGA